jgi:hypothetical protein
VAINVFAPAILTILVVGFSGFLGYKYRDRQAELDDLTRVAEVSDALAVLAGRYAERDIAYRKVAAQLRTRNREIAEEAEHAFTNIASVCGGFTSAERDSMHTAYCGYFPTAPACVVSGGVPGIPAAPTTGGGQQGPIDVGEP